jgi:hypothetical protein
MTPHQYSPLPSDPGDFIRLVKIAPEDDRRELIQLSIVQARLRNAPKYEALSYEWGTNTSDYKVSCNGQELQVRANLAAALKHLRLADKSRWVWIDAICIDQGNVTERNQQVSIMRDIYAHAHKVLIWLGDELGHTRQAFEFIKTLAKLWVTREVARMQSGEIRPQVQLEPTTVERSSLLLQDHLLWDTLFDLYSSTYFGRTWIIQEIAVSTHATVVCGPQQVNWKLFHWSACFINTTTSLLHKARDTDPLATIMGMSKFQSMSKQHFVDPLPFYLRSVQISKCTNKKDKVFGLLGLRYNVEELLPYLAKLWLQVDYNKDVEQVYHDTAAYIVCSQQDLEICYAQPLTGKTIKGLPSWVPDWSSRLEGAPTFFLIKHYNIRHSLPGRIFVYGSSMYVDGRIVDSINFTTSTISCDKPLPKIKEIILNLYKRANEASAESGETKIEFADKIQYLDRSIYINGQSVFEALWRTLIGNTANFEPANPQFKRHFRAALDIILLRERGIKFHRINMSRDLDPDPLMKERLRNDKVAQKLWRSAIQGESRRFFLELVNTIQGRVFFTTSRGYMGFGAMGAQLGDQVCILGGAKIPFILRNHDTHYKMIGDSYLHGIMQGETLDLGEPKVRRFEIC